MTRKIATLIALSPMLIPVVAQAQTAITRTVIATGGGITTSATMTIHATIGEPAVGPIAALNSGSGLAIRSGFWLAAGEPSVCYPDCDPSTGPGILDIFDFLCFGNKFAVNDPYACDCDTSTGPAVCDIFDFLCFGNAFAAGCP